MAPAIIIWARRPQEFPTRARALEAGVLLVASAAVGLVVFAGALMGAPADLPLAFLVLPVVVWGAFRFQQHGASAVAVIITVASVVSTVRGSGPFANRDLNQSLLLQQAFLGTVSLTALTLAALVRERERHLQTQRLLAQAGSVLSSSVADELNLHRFAQLVSSSMADWCGIYLATDVPDAGGGLTLAASAHRMGERNQLTARVGVPPESAGSAPVARELVALGVRSGVCVPVAARAHQRGRLVLLSEERDLDAHDVETAHELARRLGLALDNAALYQEAHHAAHAREEFLSIASHELKTPLTSMTLLVDLVIGRGRRGVALPELLPLMEQLRTQATQLGQLINVLLDRAHLGAGKLSLELAPVDLGTLVREVADRFAPELERQHTPLVLDVAGPVQGHWDRMRLEQVVTNLVSNAIKYGGGKPITVSVETRDARALLCVKDQGIGIAAESLRRLFAPFERAVSLRNYSGLGLGLYIVRMIAEAHRGCVYVESRVDEGSAFTVELPLA